MTLFAGNRDSPLFLFPVPCSLFPAPRLRPSILHFPLSISQRTVLHEGQAEAGLDHRAAGADDAAGGAAVAAAGAVQSDGDVPDHGAVSAGHVADGDGGGGGEGVLCERVVVRQDDVDARRNHAVDFGNRA